MGFKCIRQEHDALLDKVVDIQCEIDAMHDDTKPNTPHTPHTPHTQGALGAPGTGTGISGVAGAPGLSVARNNKTLVPLFRVTVAWEIKGKQVVRVYEARSPQQAWQAAVLEKIGIESATENNGSQPVLVKNEEDMDVEKSDVEKLEKVRENEENEEEAEKDKEGEVKENEEKSLYYESEDEEECRLRSEIRDQRRTFFRALRIEQRYARVRTSILSLLLWTSSCSN